MKTVQNLIKRFNDQVKRKLYLYDIILDQRGLENEWMIDSAVGAISWRDAGISFSTRLSQCIMGIL